MHAIRRVEVLGVKVPACQSQHMTKVQACCGSSEPEAEICVVLELCAGHVPAQWLT